MFSVRFTRNIQRFRHWSRFKSSSTAASVDIDAEGKKVGAELKTDEVVESARKIPVGFSKQLFETLKNVNSNELAGNSDETTDQTGDKSNQTNKQTPHEKLNQLIAEAGTLNELLAIADKPNTSRVHALKIVSTLAQWSSAGKVKPADFENNARFIRVCSLLTVGAGSKNRKQISDKDRANVSVKSKDFEMILNVAGEDESAKLIQNLQLSQMVKVLSTLAQKRTRSLSLLRNLSYGISSDTNQLNLKECSDVFYALTVLNYHDGMLMARVSMDTIANLENTDNNKAAPVGSIVKSVGFLKFQDAELLNALAKWTLAHQDLFRPKDLAALLETLAIVNHPTIHVDAIKEKLLPSISREDFSANDWVNYVWSLSALDLVEQSHFKSVLTPEFIQLLVAERGPALNTTIKKKLLNINAVAKTIATDYDGPLLKPEGSVYELPFGYSKSKQTLVDGLLDALKKLFSDQSFLETNIDTRMGFVIDAACVLDKNRTPVKFQDNKAPNMFRIAFVVLDFHDLCQGAVSEPNGISSLAIKLLKKQGYTVLAIPHTEFNTSDKIIKRVQYLDAKLKNVVSGNV